MGNRHLNHFDVYSKLVKLNWSDIQNGNENS